jgi:hypothetical protein
MILTNMILTNSHYPHGEVLHGERPRRLATGYTMIDQRMRVMFPTSR